MFRPPPFRPPQGRPVAPPQPKAPARPPGPSTQPSKPPPTPDTITVYSTAQKDELGIRTLVGEYSAYGMNHGRKFYKKSQKIPGYEDVEVFLYFWDERDGPTFSGWWFGDQVGGAQVWSRNHLTSVSPPKTGWTIPWDGEVRNELVVVSSVEKSAADKKQAMARLEMRRKEEAAAKLKEASTRVEEVSAAEWEDRVEKATERAAEAMLDVDQVLDKVNEIMSSDIDDEMEIAAAERELGAQAKALAETQRALAVEGVAAQKAPPHVKTELSALGAKMRKLQNNIKEQLQRLKNSKLIKVKQQEDKEKRAEEEVRERELEGMHSKQLEEMMPVANQKVAAAEDEVEKVAIAAAPLQIETADDLRPVMLQAIKETEQRVRAAQSAIGEARRFISGKLAQVTRFVSSTKKMAVEEFTSLQAKLTEAQNKLNPFKTIRQDYEQRVQAKKLYEELSGKLAGAEIEVEKAAMMTAPLGGDNAEGIKETENTLSAAQSVLSQASRLIDAKLKSAEKNPGPLKDEITPLRERCKQAQDKLDEVRRTVKETQVRMAADTLLREVSEKVSVAEDELQRMAEAELPFMRGKQEGEDQQMESLIEEADKIAAKVHTAIAEAQTFVARKLVEVGRFTEGPAKTVKEEIDLLQKRLEEGRERLQQFKASTADRKRAFLLGEVQGKVAAAEADLQKMSDATSALRNIGAETVTDELVESVEQANLAERAAQASLVVARKELLQKTAELKKLALAGSGSGSELGKLQTKVNTIQQDVTKFRTTTKDAEERIRVKQLLAEVATRLQTAEAEVDKVAAAAVPMADEQPAAEEVERMEKATTSAQSKLGTMSKLVDVKLKTAQGCLKEELEGMRTRITHAEKKLNVVVSAASEHKERLLASEIIAQAVEKVDLVRTEVQRASESELPFLKGIEILAASEAQAAVAACEATATDAQKAVGDARTFIVAKLAELKEKSGTPAETCSKELSALQRKLDTDAAKLAELKKDTAERKRKTQMQASSEKVAGVEQAVQTLADTMGKFSDGKLDELSPEEARSVCEEIAAAENAAQAAVNDARKFLAVRIQDAKSFSEAHRAPLTAELSKLQSRLTQCQVELAKLSKQCTEREQRFVAQKLVQDAAATVQRLKAEVETAHKVAAALLAEDKSEFLRAIFLAQLAGALRTHTKKSGVTGEGIFAGITAGERVEVSDFVAFLDKLPALIGKEDMGFTEEQASAMYKQIAGEDGKVSAGDFLAVLRDSFICAVSVPLCEAPGGQELDIIEVGEGMELIEEKEEKDGSKWSNCRLLKSGVVGWAMFAGSDGNPNFRASAATGRMQSIEAFVKAIYNRCAEAAKAADQKAVEVSAVKSGPLTEVKAKLLELRTLAGQEQTRAEGLKKQVQAAKVQVVQQGKLELQKAQEMRCKAFAARCIRECTAAVELAEDKVGKIVEDNQERNAEKLREDLSISQLEDARKDVEEAVSVSAEAKSVVAKAQEAQEAYQGPARKLLLQTRVELTKMAARAKEADAKCSTVADAVITAHKVSLVRSKFAKSAQEFCRCEKAVAITDTFIVGDANSLRKLQQGELFEILEGPKEDKDTQLQRVRGRALRDGVQGWVTLQGNQGTPFLKPREKPFIYAVRQAPLHKTKEQSSSVVRSLEQDEVLELLEGPREIPQEAEVFLRGTVGEDGSTGWITLRDISGTSNASLAKDMYVCKTAIGMTEVFDIQGGKAIRKVCVDEALQVISGEEVKADEEKGVTRLFFRAVRDGKEGWVTLKGNQGTTYVAPSTSHYQIDKAITLRQTADKDSEPIRQLKNGEMFTALDPPKEMQPDKQMLLYSKAVNDGATGWIFFAPGATAPVRPWPPKTLLAAQKG